MGCMWRRGSRSLLQTDHWAHRREHQSMSRETQLSLDRIRSLLGPGNWVAASQELRGEVLGVYRRHTEALSHGDVEAALQACICDYAASRWIASLARMMHARRELDDAMRIAFPAEWETQQSALIPEGRAFWENLQVFVDAERAMIVGPQSRYEFVCTPQGWKYAVPSMLTDGLESTVRSNSALAQNYHEVAREVRIGVHKTLTEAWQAVAARGWK